LKGRGAGALSAPKFETGGIKYIDVVKKMNEFT
jgi:hypothetical protein